MAFRSPGLFSLATDSDPLPTAAFNVMMQLIQKQPERYGIAKGLPRAEIIRSLPAMRDEVFMLLIRDTLHEVWRILLREATADLDKEEPKELDIMLRFVSDMRKEYSDRPIQKLTQVRILIRLNRFAEAADLFKSIIPAEVPPEDRDLYNKMESVLQVLQPESASPGGR
jgi:hypothetical protein